MKRQCRYTYMEKDRILGKKLSFYDDNLRAARGRGYSCFSDWIRAVYLEQGSAAGAARVLGVAYTTILRWIRRMGVETKGRGGSLGMMHPQRDAVGDLYRQLKSGRRVARVLGVSPSTVYNWLARDGIARTGNKGQTYNG